MLVSKINEYSIQAHKQALCLSQKNNAVEELSLVAQTALVVYSQTFPGTFQPRFLSFIVANSASFIGHFFSKLVNNLNLHSPISPPWYFVNTNFSTFL